LAGVIGFIAACAIAMLLILGFSYGITGLVVGLIAAILPVPVLVGCFLWLDRYEPEPTRYLVFCFAWGSSVATLVALGVNTGVSWIFEQIGLPDALVAVLCAPFVEESMKALGPILLLWRRRREWSGITDGIVYCGLSAVGFAMVENVLYLGGHGYAAGAEQYGPATGIQNVFLIFIARILFTGFAHPLFTSMSGIGLGISSRAADRRVRWLAPIAGLLVAMMLHGTFNLLPTLSAAIGQPFIMLYGYLGFMVPLFFVVVGLAIALRSWEGRLSERILPRYVSTGWLSPPEVAALGSLGRRHSARRWARRVAGESGIKAMRGFQYAATQLALLRDGMQRGLNRKPEDMHRAEAEEQRLLTAIVGYRSVFAGRDPQMPRAYWNGTDYQIAFPDGVIRTVAAPAEPVVPVPVNLPPAPVAMAMGWGNPYGAPAPGPVGYGQPGGYAAPASAPIGYGQPGGYGAPASGPVGYGQPGGYGAPASGPVGYGQPGGYSPGYAAPGYGSGMGYGPGAGPGTGYGAAPNGQPGYGGGPGGGASPPGYGGQPSYGGQPGYGGQPSNPGQPGYGGQPSNPGQPRYGGQPGYAGQPGGSNQPGYGAQPGYGGWPGGVSQPGYGARPGTTPFDGGTQPGNSPQPGAQPQPGTDPGTAQDAASQDAASREDRGQRGEDRQG
jgi:RsiW-degrading membrane proteinase PrsW (M82 family)